ncbi:transglutaminase domain-containing protein [Candidatus Sumerlaeota bacterium]|nr:transglutaminase domain-containing protein [Candidatus Sumerlaeota bacterium]
MKNPIKITAFRITMIMVMASGFMYCQNVGNAHEQTIEQARRMSHSGEFKQAEDLLSRAMETVPEMEKKALLWEKERIRRIRQDYDTTEEEIQNSCRNKIRDFRDEELKKWESEGKFDIQMIDGKKFFFSSSVSNLAKRYPEIRKRFKSHSEKDAWGEKVLSMAKKIETEGNKGKSPYVLPLRLGALHTITPKEGKVNPGEMIKVWAPFPRRTPYQKDITIKKAEPEPASIDIPESNIRSVYFETAAEKTTTPTFSLEYEFTGYGIYSKIDAGKVQPYGDDPIFGRFTRREPPNILFTPELRELAKTIVGDESNPYLKGKKIYNWICDNIVYSYAREYSTLLNIPMYVYEKRYGDCGQLGLLFITLCRCSGVPAAWRSGWECIGGERWGMHDWAAIYIKPYGWIPVDPYMGVWAIHESTLPETDRMFLRDFYYGNLDPWRLEANARNNARLRPQKADFRSETVDFQRGEIESGDRNLYFGEFRWRMRLTKIETIHP